MSSTNKLSQDLDKIAAVQDLSNEKAATCSGGLITLWTGYGQTGDNESYFESISDVGRFKDIFSSFEVEAGTTYRLYTEPNFGGDFATIGGGPTGFSGNLGLGIDNNVASIERRFS